MPNPPKPVTIWSFCQSSAAVPPGPVASSSAARAPPDIITYSYASRIVYVAPEETYDDAVDITKESFRELKDVERERISFEVKVNRPKTQELMTAEIGRTAWPFLVASLARFEVVEIRVAPHVPPETAVAVSSSQALAVEPPPYTPKK